MPYPRLSPLSAYPFDLPLRTLRHTSLLPTHIAHHRSIHNATFAPLQPG